MNYKSYNHDIWALKVSDNVETNEENDETRSKIQISPNPNKGLFNLYLIEGFEGEVEVHIFNSLGAIVYNNTVTEVKNMELNIEDQPQGVYFVKVTSGTNVKVEKIIKK